MAISIPPAAGWSSGGGRTPLSPKLCLSCRSGRKTRFVNSARPRTCLPLHPLATLRPSHRAGGAGAVPRRPRHGDPANRALLALRATGPGGRALCVRAAHGVPAGDAGGLVFSCLIPFRKLVACGRLGRKSECAQTCEDLKEALLRVSRGAWDLAA